LFTYTCTHTKFVSIYSYNDYYVNSHKICMYLYNNTIYFFYIFIQWLLYTHTKFECIHTIILLLHIHTTVVNINSYKILHLYNLTLTHKSKLMFSIDLFHFIIIFSPFLKINPHSQQSTTLTTKTSGNN
jgi:hypothetical protein